MRLTQNVNILLKNGQQGFINVYVYLKKCNTSICVRILQKKISSRTIDVLLIFFFFLRYICLLIDHVSIRLKKNFNGGTYLSDKRLKFKSFFLFFIRYYYYLFNRIWRSGDALIWGKRKTCGQSGEGKIVKKNVVSLYRKVFLFSFAGATV